MHYVYPHLLSREELIRILTERHLNIADIDALSDDELLDIFNRFAVPLSRRENRRGDRNLPNGNAPEPQPLPPPAPLQNGLKRTLPTVLAQTSLPQKQPRLILAQSIPIIGNGGPKRINPDDFGGAATNSFSPKRKKITWP